MKCTRTIKTIAISTILLFMYTKPVTLNQQDEQHAQDVQEEHNHLLSDNKKCSLQLKVLTDHHDRISHTLILENSLFFSNFHSAAVAALKLGYYEKACWYFELAGDYYQAAELAECIGLKKRAVRLYEEDENKKEVTRLSMIIANEAQKNNDDQTAYWYYERAGDNGVSHAYSLAAYIAQCAGDVQGAFRNYEKSGELSIRKEQVIKSAKFVAAIHAEQGDFEKAAEIFHQLKMPAQEQQMLQCACMREEYKKYIQE